MLLTCVFSELWLADTLAPQPDTLALAPQDELEDFAMLMPLVDAVFWKEEIIDCSVDCRTDASKLSDEPNLQLLKQERTMNLRSLFLCERPEGCACQAKNVDVPSCSRDRVAMLIASSPEPEYGYEIHATSSRSHALRVFRLLPGRTSCCGHLTFFGKFMTITFNNLRAIDEVQGRL